MFTCLVTRAIHIEVVEELSTSAFINALKRFIAISGDVKQFRSDRGTNFVETQKSKPVSNISGQINTNDMKSLFKAQWMRVQQLADMFWTRWRSEYLHTLQVRRKWQTCSPSLQTGDIV